MGAACPQPSTAHHRPATCLQASRRRDSQATELTSQLTRAQVLLKQREAAMSSLQQQLEAARARPGSAATAAAAAAKVANATPKGPLSRQNSDEEALAAEVSQKSQRIKQLEAELATARAATAAAASAAIASPRQLTPREREESGVAVVGEGSMSSFEANRLRSLKGECETWKGRSESLMAQVKELQRQQQASQHARWGGQGVGWG
jgi:chromosome segregation ATPase